MKNISPVIKELIKCYDAFSKEYDSPDHSSIQYNHTIEFPSIMDFFGKTSPNRNDAILDVGCGTGRLLKQLWGYGYRELTGFDLTEGMLNATKNKFSKVGYYPRLVKGNAEELQDYFEDETFDYAFSPFCDHIPNQDKFHNGVYQILKKGGHAFFSYPNKDLCLILRPNFLNVEADYTRFKMANGDIHTVPSKLYHPTELEQKLIQSGFENVATKVITVGERPYAQPTKYITDVANFMKIDVHEVPVVTVAVGNKNE